MPIVLFFLSVWIIGITAVLRRILVSASSRVRTADHMMVSWCRTQSARLGFQHASVISCWLVLFTTVGLAAIWWYWAPLIDAVTSDIGSSSAESLALLSPSFRDYQVSFRMTLTLLAALNLTAWYYLLRKASSREHAIPLYAKATGCAVVFLVLFSMQVPYRVIYHNDIFAPVQWRGQKCYVLGKRADDALLFCPTMTPRHQVIASGGERFEPLASPYENIFTNFQPQLR
jgi:hypothetical protein